MLTTQRLWEIGMETRFKKGHIPWAKGRCFTEEHKKKISLATKGKNNPNWQGGKTPLHQKIRNSIEYKLWRIAVFERDNYVCVWCGSNKSGSLNADHIKRFSDYPELRFAIDNGRTLCIDCHKTTDTWGSKK